MAVDEVLLDWAAEYSGCCWRFYGWQEPTLSLGYFQAHQDRREHAASRDCPAVRRLTGGGAILHDLDLTYSIVVPDRHPLAAARDLLYHVVHTSLIAVLGDLGMVARLCGMEDRRPSAAAGQGGATGCGEATARGDEPFLCFQRRSPGDVLLGETKVCGSAQRRRRGAVLQHGSVLLGRSAAAPELAGLSDLIGRPIVADNLIAPWLDRLSEKLGVYWHQEALSDRQQADATARVASRYAVPAWNEHPAA